MGVTRLLEVQKSSVFLSTLSSCQESPVPLSIKEHLNLLILQILDKSPPLIGQSSPYELRSNKAFPLKRKSALSYGF